MLTTTITKLFESHEAEQIKKKNSDESKEYIRAIREAELWIKTANNNKATLYDRYCDGDISKDAYIRLRNGEDNRLLQAEIELAGIESRKAILQKKYAGNPTECISGLKFSGKLTREISEALIECVLVYDTDRVEIKWKFNNPFAL